MTWYIADPSDAEAIASALLTEERDEDDWPHVSYKNVGEVDLASLWSLLEGDAEDRSRSTGGRLLYENEEDGPVYVFEVEPAFIERLALVKSDEVPGHAATWAQVTELLRAPPMELAPIIQGLAAFARRARTARKPVLSLATL